LRPGLCRPRLADLVGFDGRAVRRQWNRARRLLCMRVDRQDGNDGE
jgi:hypothetical protein